VTQLEDLLARDHPLAGRNRGAETVQKRGLAGLRAAGDEDVEPGGDRGLQEASRLRGDRVQRDQLVEAVRLQDELADVDRHVAAGDVGDDDVQAGAIGHGRVDEGGRHVDPPSRRAQHPLNQIAELTRGQDGRRQLAATAAGDEDPTRLIHPDLFDLGVVQVALQRAEARHPVQDVADHGLDVTDGRQRRRQRALGVVGDDVPHKSPNGPRIGERVEAATPDELPHLAVDHIERARHLHP